MKPFYEDEHAVIFNCDLADVNVEDLPPIACVVGSPPYNVGIDYDGHDDQLTWGEYLDLVVRPAASVIKHSMVDGARSWINVMPNAPERRTNDGQPIGRVDLSHLWASELELQGLHYRDTVIWLQDSHDGGCSWGSWQRPTAPNLRGEWEAILLHHKGDWFRQPPEGQEAFRDSEGGWETLCRNVWRMVQSGPTGHPVPFPLELPMRCIRLSSWPGEWVLDPFMGGGTSLLAARRLGRKAVGIDKSERYCEMAANRLAQGSFDFEGAA